MNAMLNISTDDMRWKYMIVLEKEVMSQNMAIHRVVDPTTQMNCRKTLHLQIKRTLNRAA
jgi:hypothetical protein